MTDLLTFMLDNSETVFKYEVKKHIFTPREVKENYIDEVTYYNESFGLITQCIELPNGDVLLEFTHPSVEDDIKYYRLSDVRLSRLTNEELEELSFADR